MTRAIQHARHQVIGLLILLFAVTYLDRICLSVAGPRMQADLHIDPVGWGWVTGIFTLSYCLFEIPTGTLGHRRGPRRVLTRIVLWWSVFTALTGAVTRFPLLLVSRFLFGAGEAGVFPNGGIVVSRWFPPSQRATLSGINLMACQIGGALAPLLVVPIQVRWGWRTSFFYLRRPGPAVGGGLDPMVSRFTRRKARPRCRVDSGTHTQSPRGTQLPVADCPAFSRRSGASGWQSIRRYRQRLAGLRQPSLPGPCWCISRH